MTKEELKALGLTEEQATKVTEDYEKNYVTKVAYEEKKTELSKRDNEVKTMTAELNTLKKDAGKDEELTAKIEALQKAAKEREATYQKELNELKLTNAVEVALMNAKAKNTKAVRALLSLDDAEMKEDGTVKGLDKQLKALIESEPYLFDTETATVRGLKPGETKSGGNTQTVTAEQFARMTYSERVKLYAENKDLYDELVGGSKNE